MQHKALIAPVLTYLFHRLEARFDGRPTLLILDEAWTFLDDALFAARIREWLKTLRKKNVAVVFATQSLADIERSTIAPALIESCPTRIFLPNDRALEPQARAVYERFGLNARQIEILSLATPKRDYYAQTARGNRLFELGLGAVALAFAAASPDDQRLIDRCGGAAGPAASPPPSCAPRAWPGRPSCWKACGPVHPSRQSSHHRCRRPRARRGRSSSLPPHCSTALPSTPCWPPKPLSALCPNACHLSAFHQPNRKGRSHETLSPQIGIRRQHCHRCLHRRR